MLESFQSVYSPIYRYEDKTNLRLTQIVGVDPIRY